MTPPNTIPRFLSTVYDTPASTFRLTFDERFLREAETTPYGNISARQKRMPNFAWNPRTDDALGIDGCLAFESPLTYRYALPCFYRNPHPCPKCDGTGYDDGCACLSCRGTGTQRDDDRESRKSFADFGLTLHVISDLLMGLTLPFNRPDGMPFVPEHGSDMQTMMFFVDKDAQRDSVISGWLHDDVIAAARIFTNEETACVREAMRSVGTRLYAEQLRSSEHEFHFYHDDHFELQVPGSLCALILDKDGGASWSCGRRLYCSNVDDRSSQVMLLAGLAMIDALASERRSESSARQQFIFNL
ncbi:MAG TPA: hypothetical protein VN420_01070 [Candidatus Fimivivens sp.]|nr:hypothetical protein [Candidatus Fimivivens sp.]